MKMLRDVVQTHPELLLEVLNGFEHEFEIDPKRVSLLRFEVISPDSFMWRLAINGAIYYLYAEDYIPNMGHVKHMFDHYLENQDWQLLIASHSRDFESSSPVAGSTTYVRPDDADDIMKYSVDSGYDFVFLARSNEEESDGWFSDRAPRGFAD